MSAAPIPDLSGQIALVTGASRGIGYASAVGLAKAGAHVVALARTVGGLEELDDEIFGISGARATLVPADVTDYDALDRLGATLFKRYGRLDILVANAAILGSLSPLGHIKPKEFERVMAVNVTANWRLIRAMDPLLRMAPAGHAIFLVDSVANQNQPYWGAYAASKLALESIAKTYAAETAHTKVKVDMFDPGPTRTHLRGQAFPGDEQSKSPSSEAIYAALNK